MKTAKDIKVFPQTLAEFYEELNKRRNLRIKQDAPKS